MRPHLFLDSEWANDVTRELVSLAITNADGSRKFYAERDPLPAVPSSFVAKFVYPLLERGATALSNVEFGFAIRRYIQGFDNPIIHFDAPLDRTHLKRALSGFGHLDEIFLRFDTRLVSRKVVLDRVEEYFSNNPIANSRRHHAAVDAEALRWAFTGIIDA